MKWLVMRMKENRKAATDDVRSLAMPMTNPQADLSC